MTKKWTPKQVKFQEWLAVGKYERIPAKQGEFAKAIGVHESTLSKWKQTEGWHEAVKGMIDEYLKDQRPNVYGALLDQAMRGSYQHIKLLLDMLGDTEPGSDTETKVRIVIEYANNNPDPA